MIEASKGIESTKFSSDLNFGGGSASFGHFGLSCPGRPASSVPPVWLVRVPQPGLGLGLRGRVRQGGRRKVKQGFWGSRWEGGVGGSEGIVGLGGEGPEVHAVTKGRGPA